jgi:heat-inducible transcriptional repressor
MQQPFESAREPQGRERQVLFAAIAEYVATGAPVSSRALSGRGALDLSPATLRRALHDLTLAGYLLQPHTSAGRVPTDRGFRVFVDALRDTAAEGDPVLRERLLVGFRELLPSGAGGWREMVRFLSDLAAQTALVITPAVADSVLRQLHFVPLGGRQLLAVVVTRDGLVHNVQVECAEELDSRALEPIHNYLGEVIAGRTLNEVRRVLRSELEDARRRCDRLREQASLLGAAALATGAGRGSELVVEGRSRLLGRPELQESVRELMAALEHKGRILDLLDRAASRDEGPLVIIGRERGAGFESCAVISAPFTRGGGEGQIGIVGPTRMDYASMIPLVRLSAELLSEDEEP